MSMTSVVAPNTSGSDSFVSLRELPLAKIISQISQELSLLLKRSLEIGLQK